MQVKNMREYALEIAATGQVVEPGESVEVDEDLGAALLEQPDNWGAGSSSASKGKGAKASTDDAAAAAQSEED